MKKYISISFLTLMVVIGLAGFKSDKRTPPPEGIQWMTMEEAFAKMQKEPRKILIDVYTDWCGWCKVMDRETFRNKAVVDYVNKKYYAVKFNAEQTEAVTLGTQKFQSKGRTHDLALALTNNQPSYPTTVFLDDQFQMIQPLAGYLKAKEFHEIITFIGDNSYKTEPFETYKSKTYLERYPAK